MRREWRIGNQDKHALSDIQPLAEKTYVIPTERCELLCPFSQWAAPVLEIASNKEET